jgi:hypothetical protein
MDPFKKKIGCLMSARVSWGREFPKLDEGKVKTAKPGKHPASIPASLTPTKLPSGKLT